MNNTKNAIRAALLISGSIVAAEKVPFNFVRTNWKESSAKAIASRRAELNKKVSVQKK